MAEMEGVMRTRFWTLYKLDRGSDMFWTGKYTIGGGPAVSRDIEKAKMFGSASHVYTFAAPHKCFQYWRAGLR